MNRIAGRAWIVLFLVFALIGGMVFFVIEFSGNAREWVFFSGSPHVYTGGRLASGVITDRTGEVLLDLSEKRTYASDPAVRRATLHWVGDRQGNISTPILGHYKNEMVGYDLLNGIYSYADQPGRVQLTLSAKVQTVALEALGDRKGTVAMFDYTTGALLCAVSTPTFDPDDVPDIAGDTTGAYDGVYLNRFLQAVYTPGSIFKLVTAAAAMETIPDIQDQTFVCKGTLEAGGGTVSCESTHGTLTFAEALTYSCNCSFAQIAQQIGGDKLQRYAEAFGVTKSLSFDGISTAAGNLEAAGASLYDLSWSGIGQHRDLVNPCQYLTFVGAIASGGNGVIPHVVASVSVGTQQTYHGESEMTGRLMSVSTAQKLKEMMRSCVEIKYGVDKFPDVVVCAKSGTAEKDGDAASNALFTGFVDDPNYPIAFIVIVQDGGYGARTCIPIVDQVLRACMEVMDEE